MVSKILVPHPFATQKLVLTHKVPSIVLPMSTANLAKLSQYGYDAAAYGMPRRAAIEPHYANLQVLAPLNAQAGLINASGDIIVRARYSDVSFGVTPGTGDAAWCAHPNGDWGSEYDRCRFFRAGGQHGLYGHHFRSGRITNSAFEGNPGQGAQFVERHWHKSKMGGVAPYQESWDAKQIAMPGDVWLEGNWFGRNGDQGNGVVSYQLSIFEPQTEVGYPMPVKYSPIFYHLIGNGIYHSYGGGGALYVGRHRFEIRPRQDGVQPQILYRQTGKKGQKPLAQIYDAVPAGSAPCVIEGLVCDGGNFDLVDCAKDTIQLRGCSGTAVVRVGVKVSGGFNMKAIGTFDSLGDLLI